MKTFKSICATLVLVVFLSISAFADTPPGDGHTPGRTEPVNGEPVTNESPSETILSDLSGLPLSILLALISPA